MRDPTYHAAPRRARDLFRPHRRRGVGPAHLECAGQHASAPPCAPAATSMRATLLGWLPRRSARPRVLDAGCGTGALASRRRRAAPQVRGHRSVADADRARARRAPKQLRPRQHRVSRRRHARRRPRRVRPRRRDGLADPLRARRHGARAWRVSPRARDARSCSLLRRRRRLLAVMRRVGRLFPRGDRAPAIEPISERGLRRRIAREPGLEAWRHRPHAAHRAAASTSPRPWSWSGDEPDHRDRWRSAGCGSAPIPAVRRCGERGIAARAAAAPVAVPGLGRAWRWCC